MGTVPARQDVNGPQVAGVFARPILLFPAAILLGIALDHLLPMPLALPNLQQFAWILPGLLILGGLLLFAMGVRGFSRARTPLPTNQPARALVTTGVYRWTRNPVYLGFFLIYVGIGVAARSSWSLALLVPLAVTIRFGVVAREEAYLEGRFGAGYSDYKEHVRRWL